ncbi:hypothetical protein, partial [Bacillus cereus]|uniref:hypothetical protein n=2 Tax=Bacillus cereus TaxID=1396 RepID=UPI0018F50CA0|nr:hypothetical protein [Bacillus cereus]MBJ8038372.1 hypothetical protein [Bacillus cereus]
GYYMSQSNIPNITPNITLTRDDALNLLLSSIAFEELGLAHIINAEGEKIQFALGTLPGVTGPGASLQDVLSVNSSVQDTLEMAMKKELLLDSKLSKVSNLISSTNGGNSRGPTGPQGPPGLAQSYGNLTLVAVPSAVGNYIIPTNGYLPLNTPGNLLNMTTTTFANMPGAQGVYAQKAMGLVIQNTGVYLASWSSSANDFKTYQLVIVNLADSSNPVPVLNTNSFAEGGGMLTGVSIVNLIAGQVIAVQNFSLSDALRGNPVEGCHNAIGGFLTLVQIG